MKRLIGILLILLLLVPTSLASAESLERQTEPIPTRSVETSEPTMMQTVTEPISETMTEPIAPQTTEPVATMALQTAPKLIPVTVNQFNFANPTNILTGDYRMHQVDIAWQYSLDVNDPDIETKRVLEGDYFTIEVDPEIYLHPNLDVVGDSNYLPPLTLNGEIIAVPTIDASAYDDMTTPSTIRYTFTKAAENYTSFEGLISFNNSIKAKENYPQGTVKNLPLYRWSNGS